MRCQYISLLSPRRLHRIARRSLCGRAVPAAKDAIAQILTNSRMCAEGHRPICQDTGIVVAFVKIGMDVKWKALAWRYPTWSTKVCGARTSIRTTRCVRRSSPTLREHARIRKTTHRRSFTSTWCRALPSK